MLRMTRMYYFCRFSLFTELPTSNVLGNLASSVQNPRKLCFRCREFSETQGSKECDCPGPLELGTVGVDPVS